MGDSIKKYRQAKKELEAVVAWGSLQRHVGQKPIEVIDENMVQTTRMIMQRIGLKYLREAWFAVHSTAQTKPVLVGKREGMPDIKIKVYIDPIAQYLSKIL